MESGPADPNKVREMLHSARALVFDFDGTLVDSNGIKRAAFEACFSEFPDHKREILSYCWANNHTPRWEKFRHVYEEILRQPYSPEIERSLHERFEAATTRQIIAAPEIPHAEQFLRIVHRTYFTALLSSTPQQILDRILAHRGWAGYFRAVQGAPVRKAQWLLDLRLVRRLLRDELLFFGDQEEDAQAAEEAGCRFIGVGAAADFGKGLLWIQDYAFGSSLGETT